MELNFFEEDGEKDTDKNNIAATVNYPSDSINIGDRSKFIVTYVNVYIIAVRHGNNNFKFTY